MITSPDNPKLKQIRKLHTKRERARSGLFVAEGEDLIAAADAAGWQPEYILEAAIDTNPEMAQSHSGGGHSGGAIDANHGMAQSHPGRAIDANHGMAQSHPGRAIDANHEMAQSHFGGLGVDAKLLDSVSSLGSGTRVIGVYPQRWSEPGGEVSVYLHGVADPGNVGTIIRSAHAFADGPVIIGAHCADPYSPKAVRASMGSIFARPPARARFEEVRGTRIAFVMGGPALEPVDGPVVLCIGGERFGLDDIADQADLQAGIPMRPGAPNSLNAAMAATVALYEQFRMARHG